MVVQLHSPLLTNRPSCDIILLFDGDETRLDAREGRRVRFPHSPPMEEGKLPRKNPEVLVKYLLGNNIRLDKLLQVCYNIDIKKERGKKMVALMTYECGLKFTGLVFENEETAKNYIKGKNPEAFKIIPVAYYTKDGKVL